MAIRGTPLPRNDIKPITIKEAIQSTNQQIWQKEFIADYDQVVLRISTAAGNSLNFGQPPPIVGHGS